MTIRIGPLILPVPHKARCQACYNEGIYAVSGNIIDKLYIPLEIQMPRPHIVLIQQTDLEIY